MSWMLPYKTPAMQALRDAVAKKPLRLSRLGEKGRRTGMRGTAGRMAIRFAASIPLRKATA